MTRLKDKVVLVTGAASGMGRSHCVRLAEEGANVIALDLPVSEQELNETARQVTVAGGSCVTGFADIRDAQQLKDAAAHGVESLGRIAAVVANAGIYADMGLSWEMTDEVWNRTIDINLTGAWNTVTATAPHLAENASIILVSSTNGIKGGARTAHYSSSKHAVVGLARTLANELGSQGIRVNTVHPGSVATPMILNAAVYAKLRPDLENPTQEDAAAVLASKNLLPVPWVDPVDVSNAVLFLASDESRYITGTQIVVDAGLTQKTA